MKYIIAILIPWFSLMTRGKFWTGLLCLALQFTMIGWIPASIWALANIQKAEADKRTNEIIKAINNK